MAPSVTGTGTYTCKACTCNLELPFGHSRDTSPIPTRCLNDSFYHEEYEGKSVWLNPPPGQEEIALLAYLKVKARAPHTQAIVALPSSSRGQNHKWLHLLKGMHKVKSITKHDMDVWIESDTGRPVTFRREMDILYDPPLDSKEEAETLEKALCALSKIVLPDMLFLSRIDDLNGQLGRGSGAQIITLVDTGASATFVSAEVIKHAGLPMKAAPSRGRGAGDNPIGILGTVTLPLRMGAYTNTVDAYVIPKVLEGVDLALGKQWQKFNRVIIDCAKPELKIRSPGRPACRLRP